ncbi:uncharacterized protein LOC110976134 [Acanthaster planci]|uniref:Uncharacterized protein LOC110976134 n=1 Tax=Acanthaster planci TaxID=133434 RepID=A0A8B7XVH4_ACAPL|nr:uncharacterized protein LOC110976134 [Acanthaster planci]
MGRNNTLYRHTIMPLLGLYHVALFCAFSVGLVTGQNEACQVCTCTPTKVVDCTGKGLTSLPPGIPENTLVLKFGHNNLTRIRRHTFKNLTRLRRLNLESNHISTIEPGGFIGLSRVLNLLLEYNHVEKLDADIMSGIGGGFGFYMRMEGNNLKSLGPLTFHRVATPYRITFRSNALVEVPSRLMYQENKEVTMYTLVFTDNKIERLAPDAFEGVKYIHTLYFTSNRIASLPENVFINTTIGSTLDLSSNLLKGLPAGVFRSSGKLRALYLNNNLFSVLSKKMFDGLHSLQEVMISNNPITKMDERVFSDTQLVNMYIYNTQLTSTGNRPFVTRNNTIKLASFHGNNIKIISDSVWQDLGPQCKVYIGTTLQRAPNARSDLEIDLVGSGFVQSINVTHETGQALSSAGFSCLELSDALWVCTPCHQGFYGGPLNSCRPCPPGGFFQNRTGQVVRRRGDMNCHFCNNGTYVTLETHPGRNIGDCVVCPSGTDKNRQAGFRACPCVSNYYRRDRFGECFPCPLEGINCSGEYQHLLPGFWWTWDWSSVDNYHSYKKFVQNILVRNDSYDRNTLSFQGALPKVQACPRNESCQNLGDGVNMTCQLGYGDFMCSQCIAGFYSWLDRCFECPRWWVFLLEVLASVLTIVLVVAIVVWDLRRHHRRGRSILSVLFSRFKILLGFYQIIGEIFDALHDLPWPRPLMKVGQFFKVLEVNIMQMIVSPRCYFPNFTYPTIYIEFMAGLSFFMLVIVLVMSVYRIKQCYLRLKETPVDVCNELMARTKQKCYLVVVVLLFITYPSLSSTILTLLPTGCDVFYLDEKETIKVLRLRSDYSIDCETDQHVGYTYVAEVSLCYVIGFPSVLLVMLWTNHRGRLKKASDPSSSLEFRNISDQTPSEDLDQQTDHDNQRHQTDDVSHRSTNNFATVASQDNAYDIMHVDPSIDQPVSLPAFSSSAARSVTWGTFLCENYKEKFWYWEIVELVRKILQVLFVLLFGAEDHFTLFATIVLSVGFLVVHAYVKPMKDAAEHRLQMCSLASIFLNLLAASLLLLPSEGSNPSNSRKEVLAVFFVLLNLSIVAFVAGSAIMTLAKTVFNTACCQHTAGFIAHAFCRLRPSRLYWAPRRRRRGRGTAGETQGLLSGRPDAQSVHPESLTETLAV